MDAQYLYDRLLTGLCGRWPGAILCRQRELVRILPHALQYAPVRLRSDFDLPEDRSEAEQDQVQRFQTAWRSRVQRSAEAITQNPGDFYLVQSYEGLDAFKPSWYKLEVWHERRQCLFRPQRPAASGEHHGLFGHRARQRGCAWAPLCRKRWTWTCPLWAVARVF